MPYSDRNKQLAAQQAHYLNNKDVYRARLKKYRAEKVAYVNSCKKVPCLDCGVHYPTGVLDFHHRLGTHKYDSPARMAQSNRNLGKIKDEIAKCDVICANCHRLRHINEGHVGEQMSRRSAKVVL
jgi:hypothetical protein